MAPKYDKGQKVKVAPVKSTGLTPRDAGLEQYAGNVGEVTDYYGLSLRGGASFYIYTVRIEDAPKEIVLHEDELESYIA